MGNSLSLLKQHVGSVVGFVSGLTSAVWLILWLIREDIEAAVEYEVPTPEQCNAGWEGKVLEQPSIKSPGSTAIQCYAPATGQLLGVVNPATPDGIDRAISTATEAQHDWAKTTFAERKRVLKTLSKYILANQSTIIQACCLDSGKTRVDAIFGEILVTAEKLQWTITHGEKALLPSRRPTNLLMFYKRNEVRYEPLGVVAACVSWNYPFHNFVGPIISGLFAGNALVIKSSEQTAWSSRYFLEIVRGALEACGHSGQLVQNVTCWPQTAAHLTSRPGISHLTFIGSRAVAHEVAKSAARALTPLCVELGGKDASIVLDDPKGKSISRGELNRICSIIMRGVFQSAGQNCIGIERVIAMPKAYDRLISILEPRTAALRVGNDLDSDAGGEVDVGAMISSASIDQLERLIEDAVSSGAKLLCGGKRYNHARHSAGSYFAPTLLIDVTPSMRLAREELFAPICVLMRANSVAEAIDMANSTAYGLGSSVFGPTASAAARANLDKVTREVKTGMVAVNDFAAYYAVQLPFGGVRGSGYGRFAGEEGLRCLCNAKSVCVDRWPRLIKTTIPGKLDYPLGIGSAAMGQGVVQVGYGESWTRRLEGLRKICGI